MLLRQTLKQTHKCSKANIQCKVFLKTSNLTARDPFNPLYYTIPNTLAVTCSDYTISLEIKRNTSKNTMLKKPKKTASPQKKKKKKSYQRQRILQGLAPISNKRLVAISPTLPGSRPPCVTTQTVSVTPGLSQLQTGWRGGE